MGTVQAPENKLPESAPTATIHGEVAATQVGQVPQMQTGDVRTGPAVKAHASPIFPSQEQLKPIGQPLPEKTASGKTVFYSRFNGTRYVMPTGHVLEFAPYNGLSFYETNDPTEIAELNKVIAISTSVICKTPVQVRVSDAHILKEVGGVHTGAQSSFHLAGMSQQSNG